MKIAIIAVTYNDEYKFEQWLKFYNEYKDCIDYYIIVDDHSKPDYLEHVKKNFKGSIILCRDQNGGSTAAYNTGISYALNNTDVDYIMLLDNDIRISSKSIANCAKFLSENKTVGMVSPILIKADSDIVDNFGCQIKKDFILDEYMNKANINDIKEKVHFCDTVPGGVNMSPASFYRIVGLQDEKLFMYSDEVDMGIRAKKHGIKMASISSSICWHQHINPNRSRYRSPCTDYLIARNKVYLAKKHQLYTTEIRVIWTLLIRSMILFIRGTLNRKPELREKALYTISGIIYGYKSDMDHNKYSML